MTGMALYSSFSLAFSVGISFSGTSRPGQPYHWKVVDLDRPLRPLTRPPEDMEKSYFPSSERLMVMGKRFETSSRRPTSELGSSVAKGMAAVREGANQGRRGCDMKVELGDGVVRSWG